MMPTIRIFPSYFWLFGCMKVQTVCDHYIVIELIHPKIKQIKIIEKEKRRERKTCIWNRIKHIHTKLETLYSIHCMDANAVGKVWWRVCVCMYECVTVWFKDIKSIGWKLSVYFPLPFFLFIFFCSRIFSLLTNKKIYLIEKIFGQEKKAFTVAVIIVFERKWRELNLSLLLFGGLWAKNLSFTFLVVM